MPSENLSDGIVPDSASDCAAADGQPGIDTQGRLPHADGDALPFFAAHADTAVERGIVAYHRNVFQHFGAVADNGRAFDGYCSLPPSTHHASDAPKTNFPLVMSTCPPPKLTA